MVWLKVFLSPALTVAGLVASLLAAVTSNSVNAQPLDPLDPGPGVPTLGSPPLRLDPLLLGLPDGGFVVPQRDPLIFGELPWTDLDVLPVPGTGGDLDIAIDGIYGDMRREMPPSWPEVLEPFEGYGAYLTPADPRRFNLNQLVVKFRDGAGVRLRDNVLTLIDPQGRSETAYRLARFGLEPSDVQRDLDALRLIFDRERLAASRLAPTVDEGDLDRLRQRAERLTGAERPEMNLFFFVLVPAMDLEEAAALRDEIDALPSVEVAYFQPIPQGAQDKPPPTTIDLRPQQGYLFSEPEGGVDVVFARRFRGGTGGGIRLVDIEMGWWLNHEDLPRIAAIFGINLVDHHHGTASIGVTSAVNNAYGVTGIASDAEIGVSSATSLGFGGPIFFYSPAGALVVAGSWLRPGDVAFFEQHFPPIEAWVGCTCNDEQCAYQLVESAPTEHAAIWQITGAGIVVVEPAGNGSFPVQPASSVDSGAIVVGANAPDLALVDGRPFLNDLHPACFTNHGTRVDVSAWGGNVATLGGREDLRTDVGGDVDQSYTGSYSGTSSATPIIAGVAALIQSTREQAGQPRLHPLVLRSILVGSGRSVLAGMPGPIGPQPNLRRVIERLYGDSGSFLDVEIPGLVNVGSALQARVALRNTGAYDWVGQHSITVGGDTPTWGFSTPSPVGSQAAPILAQSDATFTLSLQAPAKPGTYLISATLRGPSGVVLATSRPRQIIVTAPNQTYDASLARVAPGGWPAIIRNREERSIPIEMMNTGTSTWVDRGARIYRSGRISLPRQEVLLPSQVLPGETIQISVEIICNGVGQGWFGVAGPGTSFGNPNIGGGTLYCQP